MTGTCKNCIYWAVRYKVKNSVADCDKVDDIIKDSKLTFEIDAYADDSSNLHVVLKTGENFGCVNFKSK